MELSGNERLILNYLKKRNEEVEIIPEDIRGKFTPEMLQFTLAELQSKGLIEYVDGAYTVTKKAEELFKKAKPIKEEIIAWGHPDITATNETRIEITKGEKPLDNSVIAVKANKSCKDLNKLFKDYIKFGKTIKITISLDETQDTLMAFGSPALELKNEKNIVTTKSDFIENNTLAILANKAACDLKKELIDNLKKSKTKVKIKLEVK
jgi:hypothetical protein